MDVVRIPNAVPDRAALLGHQLKYPSVTQRGPWIRFDGGARKRCSASLWGALSPAKPDSTRQSRPPGWQSRSARAGYRACRGPLGKGIAAPPQRLMRINGHFAWPSAHSRSSPAPAPARRALRIRLDQVNRSPEDPPLVGIEIARRPLLHRDEDVARQRLAPRVAL
jgi:hypothetical protein